MLQKMDEYVRELLSRAASGEARAVYAKVVARLKGRVFPLAVQLAEGNRTRATRWLGIGRATLRGGLSGGGTEGEPTREQRC